MTMVPLALPALTGITSTGSGVLDNNDLFKNIVGKVSKLKLSGDNGRPKKKTRRVPHAVCA
jgi:hypothetical protein